MHTHIYMYRYVHIYMCIHTHNLYNSLSASKPKIASPYPILTGKNDLNQQFWWAAVGRVLFVV